MYSHVQMYALDCRRTVVRVQGGLVVGRVESIGRSHNGPSLRCEPNRGIASVNFAPMRECSFAEQNATLTLAGLKANVFSDRCLLANVLFAVLDEFASNVQRDKHRNSIERDCR